MQVSNDAECHGATASPKEDRPAGRIVEGWRAENAQKADRSSSVRSV